MILFGEFISLLKEKEEPKREQNKYILNGYSIYIRKNN